MRLKAPGRANKYRAQRTDGFASKREANRAKELQLLERIGAISDLRYQVRMEIIPAQEGERAAHYIADFVYLDHETGKEVWEDVKGFKTKEYVLKRKLMRWRHGIAIREV